MRRYWDIPGAMATPAAARSEDDWTGGFAGLLEDAVRIRMVADVPLGAFLSGGMDSGSVAAAMTRSGAPQVLTHTVGFGESAFDERGAARETARLLGTDHHEVFVSADIAAVASQLAWHFDEPFADACAVPTFLLCQATRQRVTVALAGDGADELIGGYRRYRFSLAEARWRSRLPHAAQTLCGLAGALYPKADWLPRPLRAKVTLENLSRDSVLAHLHSTALQQGILPGLLLRTERQDELTGYSPFERKLDLARSYHSDHLLGRLLYLDSRTLLPDRMLTKVDRASMAVGLEVREPFLDYRLVEHIARMPASLRLGKQVLRKTMERWGLGAIAQRRKQGFEVPLDAWFRGPLKALTREMLTSRDAISAEWLDPRAVRALLARHAAGWSNCGAMLWALLSLELWARRIYQPAQHQDRPVRRQTPTHVLQGSAA